MFTAEIHGRLNLGADEAFCVTENVEWKLKDAATRCVLRPVDASKCVRGSGPPRGAYNVPPDLLAGFG